MDTRHVHRFLVVAVACVLTQWANAQSRDDRIEAHKDRMERLITASRRSKAAQDQTSGSASSLATSQSQAFPTRNQRIDAHQARLQKSIDESRQRSMRAGNIQTSDSRLESNRKQIENYISESRRHRAAQPQTTESLSPERQRKILEHTARIERIIKEKEQRKAH